MAYLDWIKNLNKISESIGNTLRIFNDSISAVANIVTDIANIFNNPDNWIAFGEMFGEQGWTIPRSATTNDIVEMFDMLDENRYDDFDTKMIMLFDDDFEEIIAGIDNSNIDIYYKGVFKQSYQAFSQDLFHPALTSLTAIADGLLADAVQENKIKFYVRINTLENNLNLSDFISIAELASVKKSVEIWAASSENFKEEPNNYNRHWLMHGRTRRCLGKKDYYQLLSFVDTLIGLAFNNEVS